MGVTVLRKSTPIIIGETTFPRIRPRRCHAPLRGARRCGAIVLSTIKTKAMPPAHQRGGFSLKRGVRKIRLNAAVKTKPNVLFEPTSGGGVTERGSWVFTATGAWVCSV
jgi:hypothetical protein